MFTPFIAIWMCALLELAKRRESQKHGRHPHQPQTSDHGTYQIDHPFGNHEEYHHLAHTEPSGQAANQIAEKAIAKVLTPRIDQNKVLDTMGRFKKLQLRLSQKEINQISQNEKTAKFLSKNIVIHLLDSDLQKIEESQREARIRDFNKDSKPFEHFSVFDTIAQPEIDSSIFDNEYDEEEVHSDAALNPFDHYTAPTQSNRHHQKAFTDHSDQKVKSTPRPLKITPFRNSIDPKLPPLDASTSLREKAQVNFSAIDRFDDEYEYEEEASQSEASKHNKHRPKSISKSNIKSRPLIELIDNKQTAEPKMRPLLNTAITSIQSKNSAKIGASKLDKSNPLRDQNEHHANALAESKAQLTRALIEETEQMSQGLQLRDLTTTLIPIATTTTKVTQPPSLNSEQDAYLKKEAMTESIGKLHALYMYASYVAVFLIACFIVMMKLRWDKKQKSKFSLRYRSNDVDIETESLDEQTEWRALIKHLETRIQ